MTTDSKWTEETACLAAQECRELGLDVEVGRSQAVDPSGSGVVWKYSLRAFATDSKSGNVRSFWARTPAEYPGAKAVAKQLGAKIRRAAKLTAAQKAAEGEE